MLYTCHYNFFNKVILSKVDLFLWKTECEESTRELITLKRQVESTLVTIKEANRSEVIGLTSTILFEMRVM